MNEERVDEEQHHTDQPQHNQRRGPSDPLPSFVAYHVRILLEVATYTPRSGWCSSASALAT